MNEQRKQFLLALFAYVAEREVSPEELGKHCGIDPNKLLTDKDYAADSSQINSLWVAASKLCRDNLFGLHFGQSLQLAALGAVGGIIKSSHTVGEALTIASNFTPVVTEEVLMEVSRTENSINVSFVKEPNSADDFFSTQVTDFLMVFTIHELNGFLLKRVKPLRVNIPTLNKVAEYERAFRCKPTQGDVYSIQFDGSYWDVPIITANYELQQFLLERIGNSMQTSLADSFKTKITDYLSRNAYLGLLSLEDVAANFNITPRSLQRRLREESTSFQALADAVRKSLALSYLSTGKYQLKEISSILGYNEVSAFSRAFKRWTGQAPMEYKA
jgi:AraC-like DNA-binding protein